jgi:hypothetical protein
MAEDEELVTQEELFDFRNFVARNSRDGTAFILFRVASEQDAGGGTETSYKIHFLKSLYFYHYPLTLNICVGDGGLCVGVSVSVGVGVGVKVGV